MNLQIIYKNFKKFIYFVTLLTFLVFCLMLVYFLHINLYESKKKSTACIAKFPFCRGFV